MPARRSPGSSVKDPALYEKLRTEGNSKGMSARTANAAAASSRKKVSNKGGKSGRYDDWPSDRPSTQGEAGGHQGALEDVREGTDGGVADALM